MEIPAFIPWIISESRIKLEEDKEVECYFLDYDISNEETLNAWAKHIRRQYESDTSLDESIIALGLEKEEYLRGLVIPQKEMVKGPMTRSADFGEIIIADLIQYIKNYDVPRCKMYNRATPTQSQQGTDILAYKFINANYSPSDNDEMLAIEVKWGASKNNYSPLIDALKDSKKDKYRAGITLNFYRKQLMMMGNTDEALRISRFQKKSEVNYKIKMISAAGINKLKVDAMDLCQLVETESNLKENPLEISGIDGIFLMHCDRMMDLIHELSERCIE